MPGPLATVRKGFRQAVGLLIAPLLLMMLLSFLAFPVVTCQCGFSLLRYLVRWQQARSWVATPARVLAVELISGGDEGESCKVRVQYTYTHENRDYIGHRVGLSNSIDQQGSWGIRQHKQLDRVKIRGDAIPCYVDPHDPAQAVLDRRFHTWAFCSMVGFAAGFGAASVTIVAVLLYALHFAHHERRLKAEWPAKPWMWEEPWARRKVLSNSRLRTSCAWLIAVFITGLLWCFTAQSLDDREFRGFPIPLVLSGTMGLLVPIWFTVCHRRFGRTVFELHTLPGEIGGHLAGDLVIRGAVERVDSLSAKLVCISHVSRGEESKRKTLWEATLQKELPRNLGTGEARVPLVFEIPESCKPTAHDAKSRIDWQLRIRLMGRKSCASLKFKVPVFEVQAADVGGEPAA